MAKALVTAERLRELVDYDPETGVFRWRMPRKKIIVGSIAGGIRPDGYHSIGIDGRRYISSRLAWLYVHGEWPAYQIDHINMNRGDDRLVNLRQATHSENKWNQGIRANNTSGYKGVHWDSYYNKWHAQITVDYKKRHLGYFVKLEDAYSAYCAAAEKFYGEFARVA